MRIPIACNICGQNTVTYDPKEFRLLGPKDIIHARHFLSAHYIIPDPAPSSNMECPFCHNSIIHLIRDAWTTCKTKITIAKDWDD